MHLHLEQRGLVVVGTNERKKKGTTEQPREEENEQAAERCYLRKEEKKKKTALLINKHTHVVTHLHKTVERQKKKLYKNPSQLPKKDKARGKAAAKR